MGADVAQAGTGFSTSSLKWEDKKRNLCPQAGCEELQDEGRAQASNHM